MGAAARLVDEVAHRHAGGRWLATGGGGYDAYRVVPRAWALVWLAGAHREARRDAGRVARALGGRGGWPRVGPAARAVRRRAERRAQPRPRPARRGAARPTDGRGGPVDRPARAHGGADRPALSARAQAELAACRLGDNAAAAHRTATGGRR